MVTLDPTSHLIVVALALTALQIGPALEPTVSAEPALPPPVRSGLISLGGTSILEDICTSHLIGEPFPGEGGTFGSYTWMGDINDDGLTDIAISAPKSPGSTGVEEDGRVYFYFGKEGQVPESMDVTKDAPDMTISGGSPAGSKGAYLITSQLTSGDYNGDGRTDLAICLPMTMFSGIGVVLYRGSDAWPTHMVLGQMSSTGIPVITVDQGSITALRLDYCGGVVGPTDLQMPYIMRSGDIDKDGHDDIVYAGVIETAGPELRKWNAVIAWGGHIDGGEGDRYRPVLETTVLLDLDDLSGYGTSLDIGDIDADGWTDLAVGAPAKTRPEFNYRGGAVYLYFNISSMRNATSLDATSEDVFHTVIHGTDSYDSFGTSILIKDVSGDGRDDLLASAPYADGPGDSYPSSGEISVFRGRPIEGFPREMIAGADMDLLVHGPTGPCNSDGDGFRIGQMFRLGDLTGDGRPDLVLGINGVDLPPTSGLDRRRGGVVLLFEGDKVFPKGIKAVQLGYPSMAMTLEATDMEDALGFHISVHDHDGNGIADLLIGAPSADGPGNERPRCGEAYLLLIPSLRLGEPMIGGPAYADGVVFASDGTLDIDIPVTRSGSEGPIAGGAFMIGPPAKPVIVEVEGSSATLVEDPYGCVGNVHGSVQMGTGATDILSLSIELGWYYPQKSSNTMSVTAVDEQDRCATRTYHDVFDLAKDLIFMGDHKVRRNDDPLLSDGTFVTEGDIVHIEGPSVRYKDYPERAPSGAEIMVDVTSGGDIVASLPAGEGWEFTDTIEGGLAQEWRLDLWIDMAGPSVPALYPDLQEGYTISVRIDLDVPNSPLNLSLSPTDGSDHLFGRLGQWTVRTDDILGSIGDPGGSGVRSLEVELGDGTMAPMMHRGGLFATYYDDDRMMGTALEVVDEVIDHDWGRFGPYPETGAVPPYGFSVRWHGWLDVPQDGVHFFELSGQGEGTLILGGEALIDWSDLSEGPRSGIVQLKADGPREIVVGFIQGGKGLASMIELRWMDDQGSLVPVPSSVLLYPSNETEIPIDDASSSTIGVRARDWVGLVSQVTRSKALIDMEPPSVQHEGHLPWYNTTRPELHFRLWDPDSDGEPSGIDLSTVAYRTLMASEEYGTWTSEGLFIVSTVSKGDAELEARISVRPTLLADFTGSIEVQVSDRAGNTARTPPLFLGIDMKRPKVTFLEPRPNDVLTSNDVGLRVRLTDIGGSGVDLETMRWRTRTGEGDWTPWNPSGFEGLTDDSTLDIGILLPSGPSEVEVMALDAVGNAGTTGPMDIVVSIPPIDLPPVPLISSPANNTRTFLGWPLVLDSTGTRDDGLGRYDPVLLSWYSNVSGFLGSGQKISVRLPVGTHRITLRADDGTPGHNTSTSIVVVVLPMAEGTDQSDEDTGPREEDGILVPLLIGLLGAIVVAGVSLMVLFAYNRKAGPTARIDHRYGPPLLDGTRHDRGHRFEE